MTDPLKAFLDNYTPIERPIVDVDLSEFGVNLVVQWQEPDALRAAQAQIDASILAEAPSLLDPMTAAQVANLSALHVGALLDGVAASGSGSLTTPSGFYKQLATSNRNARLWSWLVREAESQFPAYFGSQELTLQAIADVAAGEGLDLKTVTGNLPELRRLASKAQKKIAAGWLPSAPSTSGATPSDSPQDSPS